MTDTEAPEKIGSVEVCGSHSIISKVLADRS